MALEEMFHHIEEEVQSEIADQINRAKLESTQTLMAFGESLEKEQDEKLADFKKQLTQKETMLKSEQDFQYQNQQLIKEKQLIDMISEELEISLLEYIQNHNEQYQTVMKSWLNKSNIALQNAVSYIHVSEKDTALFDNIIKSLGIQAQVLGSSNIKAGMLVKDKNNTEVDLTFDTVFLEQKQQLLNIVMKTLGENQ